MRIVVSSEGDGLDATASTVFGRCPIYLFIDTQTLEFESVANPAVSQGGGAGIQAAQFVVNRGAQAVLTGNLGPNALEVFQAAGVSGYLVPEGTVRQAVAAYDAGRLAPLGEASVGAHAGMGGRRAAERKMGAGGSSNPPPEPRSKLEKEKELASLGETLKSLRQQLAATMERIEQLDEEE